MSSKGAQTEEEWRAECLVDYVRDRMTPRIFAEHIGTSRSVAYKILLGDYWKATPRPEGFLYPWPEAQNPVVISQRRKEAYADGYKRFEEGKWTYRKLAYYLGIPTQTAWDVVQRKRKQNASG